MYWNNMVVNTLHQDRINEALRNRLTVDILEAHPESDRGYVPALAWVGERIKDFGSRLVEIAGQPEQSLN
jgi:hypothetical protein